MRPRLLPAPGLRLPIRCRCARLSTRFGSRPARPAAQPRSRPGGSARRWRGRCQGRRPPRSAGADGHMLRTVLTFIYQRTPERRVCRDAHGIIRRWRRTPRCRARRPQQRTTLPSPRAWSQRRSCFGLWGMPTASPSCTNSAARAVASTNWSMPWGSPSRSSPSIFGCSAPSTLYGASAAVGRRLTRWATNTSPTSSMTP